MSLTELDRSNIPQLESTEKFAVLVYYKTGDAVVEEISSLLSTTDDSVLLNANWFKCCVYPEESVNYVGASIAAVIGIDIENVKENVVAVMLEEKGKKFGTSVTSPLDKESLKNWLKSVQDGTATPSVKSEDRLPNDEFPDKKGLTKLVANAFNEIVMNPANDVFVDIYADWCGPCQMIAPLIAKVAKVLADEPHIIISKMNSDLNDYSDKLFPEGSIPNMKLFKAGDFKEQPIKFDGERSAAGILKWLHDNCVNKFDFDKYLPICQKYDDFFPTRLEAEYAVQEVKDDLEFKTKCEEGNISAVEKLVADLESSIEDEDVDQVTKLIENLRVSSDREAIRVIADKARLGDVVKIHSQEEFDTTLKTDKLIVVDFTAQWCGPCQYIAPIFAAMSTMYPEAVFLKVDVDECNDVAGKCGVNCMPTFQLYKNGTKIEEVQGADPESLEVFIQKHK